jgi:hypothetical protein
LVSLLLLGGCAPHQGTVTTGGGTNAGTMMSGSAGGAANVNANKSLTHCTNTLGTLAVDDGQIKGSSSVTSVDPLIRLAIQQSNCFVITSIGNTATSNKLDRFLDKQRNSGEYRAGSKQEKGQRVVADYFLEPQVVINNETTSGSGAAIGAALGTINPLAGALVGAMGSNTIDKTTEVALTLTDIRSTVQIGIAQGTASTSNYASAGGIGGILGSFAGAVGMSSFTRTPEGQATAAAFFDAYNQLVDALRNYQAQDVKGGLGRGGHLKVK